MKREWKQFDNIILIKNAYFSSIDSPFPPMRGIDGQRPGGRVKKRTGSDDHIIENRNTNLVFVSESNSHKGNKRKYSSSSSNSHRALRSQQSVFV